jgi:hypothetical protein
MGITGIPVIDAMTKDYLEKLTPDEVAAWYLRLAQFIEQKNKSVKNPLAPQLPRHWVNGQGKKTYLPGVGSSAE